MIHFKTVTSVCLNVWKQNIIILSWMGELWPDDPTHSRSEPPSSLKLNIFRLIRPSAGRKCRFLLPSASIDIFSFTVLKDQVWRRGRKESYRLHLLIVCIRWRVYVCFLSVVSPVHHFVFEGKSQEECLATISNNYVFHSRDEGPCNSVPWGLFYPNLTRPAFLWFGPPNMVDMTSCENGRRIQDKIIECGQLQLLCLANA